MIKNTAKQFAQFTADAENILILLPAYPNNDARGAGHALAHVFAQAEKSAAIAYDHGTIQSHTHDTNNAAEKEEDTLKENTLRDTKKHIPLLSKPKKVIHSLSGAREMIVSFDTTYNKISHVRTEKTEKNLTIYITPEKSAMDPRDFSFAPAQFSYDLIIACGAQNKESFGALYEQCPDIFYEVPIINIDTSSENDRFGQVNIIDVTASSLSEIVFTLLQETHNHFITDTTAQDLLFGLISATNSFQDTNTTPQSLHTASALIESGADQQKIVKHLYKTQSFERLKLWGAAMARMQWAAEHKMISLQITQKDFTDTQTTPADLHFIIAKIKQNYSAGKIFLILYEDVRGKIHGLIDAQRLGALPHLDTLPHIQEIDDTYAFSLQEFALDEAHDHLIKNLFS